MQYNWSTHAKLFVSQATVIFLCLLSDVTAQAMKQDDYALPPRRLNDVQIIAQSPQPSAARAPALARREICDQPSKIAGVSLCCCLLIPSLIIAILSEIHYFPSQDSYDNQSIPGNSSFPIFPNNSAQAYTVRSQLDPRQSFLHSISQVKKQKKD